MKIQLNKGIISDLPINAVVAVGAGDIEVDEVPKNAFDYDYINGEFIRTRWNDWHEDTNFQIKFAPVDLLELLRDVPFMIEYTSTLNTYVDEFGNQYLYVNYFVDMERELCERYGAIITERI